MLKNITGAGTADKSLWRDEPKVNGTVVLTSLRTRGILGGLDILVDIGVFAEKEVIQ